MRLSGSSTAQLASEESSRCPGWTTAGDIDSVDFDFDFYAFPHTSSASRDLRLRKDRETRPPVPNASHSDDGVQLSNLTSSVHRALEALTVDFHGRFPRPKVPPALDIGAALRNGDLAMVEADGRERCTELMRVLSLCAQRGAHQLRRLEFGCTDENGKAHSSGHDHECVLDPAGPHWVSSRLIVEPLEKLVDGPVVFTGYRFFPG